MIQKDPVEELQEKLDELIRLRKKEEQEYGRLLTLLDQGCQFPLPQEAAPQLSEIKDELNRVWDVSENASTAAAAEDGIFWKEVAQISLQILQPFLRQQREFNSLVVHLLNEFNESVVTSLSRIREFHTNLILYFQRIIPIVDTKFREMVGVEDKNVVVNLLKYQNQIHEAARDHADLLFQELDRRIETLQVDSKEQQDAQAALQTALRSLHHLANSLKSSGTTKTTAKVSDHPYRYYHFEEDFRGSREEIKKKFAGYIQYFRNQDNRPVLDLGCGRGEFLELLKEAGIPGIGVDSNQKMVAQCRELGLNVESGDLIQFLKSQRERSLGGIFCSQVIEHLPPELLMHLLELSHTRLADGATILLETINIGSGFGFLQVYTKDLTHRTPIHPETLKFLVAACGFQRPEIIFTSPVPAVAQLKLLDDVSDEVKLVFNQNMSKLNELLFAPQEYLILASK